MKHSEAGKGSKSRPMSVTQEEFDKNFDRIFRKKTTSEMIINKKKSENSLIKENANAQSF